MRNIRPSGSAAVAFRNVAACSGVHRRASVWASGSSSTPAHGLKVIFRCFTAAFSAARSVANIRRWVVGPTILGWLRTSPSISMSALPSVRWRSISALYRSIVANTPAMCPAFSRSSWMCPRCGFSQLSMCWR